MTALGLAALLPLCSAPTASAQSDGYWASEAPSVSGTATETYVGPFGESETGTWDVTDWEDFTYGSDNAAESGFGPWYGVNGLSGLARFKCTQTFIFDWVGSGEPPKKAYFLVTDVYAYSYASATMYDQSQYGQDFPSGLIAGELGGMHLDDPDDGFGDKPVASTTIDLDPLALYGPRFGELSKISSSPGHLIQKDGSSGQVTITVSGSGGASGTTSNKTYMNYGEGVYGAVTPVTVAPAAPPHAMITSSINTSYHKGGDGKQEPNSYSADGSSIQADSVLTGDSSGNFVAQPSFGAVSSFTNPSYAWSNSGSGSLLGTSGDTTSLFVGATDVASVPGMTSTITLNASDTDSGTTASATYAINWHLTYEKSDPGVSWQTKEIFDTRLSGLSPSQIGVLNESPGNEFPIEATADGVAVAVELAGPEGATLSALAKVVGAILSVGQWSYAYDEEPKVSDGARNDATSWQVAQHDNNVPLDLANTSDGWMQCTMDWCRVRHESGDDWFADLYDGHGYNSPNHLLHAPSAVWFDEEPFFHETNPY